MALINVDAPNALSKANIVTSGTARVICRLNLGSGAVRQISRAVVARAAKEIASPWMPRLETGEKNRCKETRFGGEALLRVSFMPKQQRLRRFLSRIYIRGGALLATLTVARSARFSLRAVCANRLVNPRCREPGLTIAPVSGQRAWVLPLIDGPATLPSNSARILMTFIYRDRFLPLRL
jgi:hypothetical protein